MRTTVYIPAMAGKQKAPKRPTANSGSVWYPLLLVSVVFLMYGKSMNYGFVLDDDLFIRNNPVVQKGVSGIADAFDRPSLEHFKGSNFQMYRPAVITAFCIQRSLFRFEPGPYHFVNLLLYAVVCIIVYRLCRTLFPAAHAGYAFLTAFLYAVHPVHTEVVANIKGQDELWASLGALLSLKLFLDYLDRPAAARTLMASLGCFVLALFSKESSVAFLALFPVTAFIVKKRSVRESVIRSFPFLGAAALFLLCRLAVLHGVRQDYETTVIENSLYGASTLSERFSTVASILLNNWKLLVWPHPLSWDYSFNQLPLTSWSDPVVWISVLLYLAAAVFALRWMRQAALVSWGLVFFLVLILPTSNIFFLNGTTYAERFLFLPSVGIVVALTAWLLQHKGVDSALDPFRYGKSLAVPLLAVCLTAAVASSYRCDDWKDNLALFESGVISAPNSSRTQMALATEYMNRAEKSSLMQERQELIVKSKEHFRRSLEIFPDNASAAYKLGLIYAITGDTASAIGLYRHAIRCKQDDVFSLVNLATIYSVRNKSDSALYYLRQSFAADSLNEMTLTNLMVVHFNRGEDAEVVRYGETALRNGLSAPKIADLLARSQGRLEAAMR